MAGTVPQEARALYTFASTHAQRWEERFAEIGLTQEQAAQVAGQVPQLREAIRAASAARQAALDATQQMNAIARSLFEAAAGAVRTIRAHADWTNDGTIYGSAGIEPPKVRSRQSAPPSTPTALAATINSMGEVILTWKTKQPRGVSNVTFEIHRAFNNDLSTMKIIDTTAGREFVDSTIPRGTHSVHYILVPKRGAQEGPASDLFSLMLGSVVPRMPALAPTPAMTETRRVA
jgi:hypothetical protein